jgi:hypothetical protein
MALPATDAFTGTNGTALQTYSANWTINSGALQIQSNAVTGNQASVDSVAHWNADNFPNNQYCQAVLAGTITNDNHGVCVRVDASARTGYVFFAIDPTARSVYRIDAGAYVLLTIDNTAPVVGQTYRIEISGSAITAKVNGSVIAALSTTDSTYSSGFGGISGYNNSNTERLDNWEAGDLNPPAGNVYVCVNN